MVELEILVPSPQKKWRGKKEMEEVKEGKEEYMELMNRMKGKNE